MNVNEWLKEDWPIKLGEGSIAVGRIATENRAKYEATITFFAYDSKGFPNSRGLTVVGKSPEDALKALWAEMRFKITELYSKNELPAELRWWVERNPYLEKRRYD